MNVVEPLTEPEVAVIVVVPAATLLASPAVLMVATLGAEVGVRFQRASVPGEHLAGVSHNGYVHLMGHASLIELLRQVRSGPGIPELQACQGRLLVIIETADNPAHDLGPLKRQLPIKHIQVGRAFHCCFFA